MEGLRILSRPIRSRHLPKSLPDGIYALISCRGGWSTSNVLANAFPWWVIVLTVSNGHNIDWSAGSNISRVLINSAPINEVLLVNVPDELRYQLDQILAENNIKLIDV